MKNLHIAFDARRWALTAVAAGLILSSGAYAQTTGTAVQTTRPAPQAAAEPVLLNLDEIVDQLAAESPAVNGLHQKVLHNDPRATIVLLSLEKDGIKADHAVPGTGTITVIKGAIDFDVAGKVHKLKAGNVIVLEPNVMHNLTATEKSLVLVTISKSAPGSAH